MPTKKDDSFQVIWGPSDGEENLQPSPGDLLIGTSRGRILVVIRPNGNLEYGPDYTPDEAAEEFWEALARKRLDFEDRLILINHMEGALTRLGAADLHNEAAIRRLSEEQTTETLLNAQRAQRALERAMHQCIELGRGLTRRPEVAPIPREVPRQIEGHPESSYSGAEGFEDPEAH